MDIDSLLRRNIQIANDASDPNQLYRWLASIRDYMADAYRAVDAVDAFISNSALLMQREIMTLSTRLATAERHLSARLHSVTIDSPVPVNISSALSPSFDVTYDPYTDGYTLRSASYHNFVTDRCTLSIPHHVGTVQVSGLDSLTVQRSDKLASVEISTSGYDIGASQYPWLRESTYQGAPLHFGGAFLLDIDPGMVVLPNHVVLSTLQSCDIVEVHYYYAVVHNADMVSSQDLAEWSVSGSFHRQMDSEIGRMVLISDNSSAEIHHSAGSIQYLNGTNPYITIQQGRPTARGISKFLRLRAAASSHTQVSITVAWFSSGGQYLNHERHLVHVDSPHYSFYDVELFPPRSALYCRLVMRHHRTSPEPSTLKIAEIGLYDGYEIFSVDAASNEYIGILPSTPVSRVRLLVNPTQSTTNPDGTIRYLVDITDIRLGYSQIAQKGDLYLPDITAEEGLLRRISVVIRGYNLENCSLVLRRNKQDSNPNRVQLQSDGIECSFVFVEDEARVGDISPTSWTTIQKVVCPPTLVTEMFSGTSVDRTVRLKYAPLVDVAYIRSVLDAGMEYNPNAMPTDPSYWERMYRSRLGAGARIVTTGTRDWLLYLLYPTSYSNDLVRTGVIHSEWIGIVGYPNQSAVTANVLQVDFDPNTRVSSYWQPGDYAVARVTLEYKPSQPLSTTFGTGGRYHYIAIRIRGSELEIDDKSPDPVYHVSAAVNSTSADCIWAVADQPMGLYTIGYVIVHIPDGVAQISSVRVTIPVKYTAVHLVAVDRKIRLTSNLDGYPPVRVTVSKPDAVFIPDTSYLIPTGVYTIEREKVRDATSERITEYEREVAAGRVERSTFTRTTALKALQFYPIAKEGERDALKLEVASLDENGTVVFRELPPTAYTLLPELGLVELFYDVRDGESVYATYKFVLKDDATAARFVDLRSGMSFTRNITDYVNGRKRPFKRLEMDKAHPEYHPVIEYQHRGRILTFNEDLSELRGVNTQIYISYMTMIVEPSIYIELRLNDKGEPPVVTRVYAYKEEIV